MAITIEFVAWMIIGLIVALAANNWFISKKLLEIREKLDSVAASAEEAANLGGCHFPDVGNLAEAVKANADANTGLLTEVRDMLIGLRRGANMDADLAAMRHDATMMKLLELQAAFAKSAPEPERKRRGPNKHLTPDQVAEIRLRFRRGRSGVKGSGNTSKLAQEYGVSSDTIKKYAIGL